MDEQRPATYSHDAARERVEWLPPVEYRRWRDVGVRGFEADGLPDERFRGRWSGRNVTFCDLMVRTGLRLAEQAALTRFEVPLGPRGRWLSAVLAADVDRQGRLGALGLRAEFGDRGSGGYVEIDRAEVIAVGRAADRYGQVCRPLVVEDPARPVATHVTGAGVRRRRIKVAHLDADERRSLLIDGPDGLEPALFWLGEHGRPLTVARWKKMFDEAKARCGKAGVNLAAHAHLLRHTFAVVTLEQLQRGHIAALAEMTEDQRGHYTRIFGDPLDWVRRRLGHRSVVTTQIYLHLPFGTSASGFRAEVESEQALARGEDLLAMVDQHQHHNLVGPAADEGARRLTELTGRARFNGIVITDRRRLDRLMRRDDPAIYPGKYVTCVHNHATALCQQRRDSEGALRPDYGTCKPLSCRNVALTLDNVDHLRSEVVEIDRQTAARPALPPLFLHQLRRRRDEITAFLARHIQPTGDR